MPGVDFVINALLETSGLRCSGDCASPSAQTMKDSPETSTHGSVRRMMRSVIGADETQSANACRRSSIPLLSIRLFKFAQQLVLQMSPRGLFNRATLVRYLLLLRLSFMPRSRFHWLRHVPDLGPARADASLFWFCVRIHKCLALSVRRKNSRNAACRAIMLSTEDCD